MYPNGISTSLPFDVQYDLVRSIAGFEHAEITRPGYAIEYDFFDPRDLKPSLETRRIDGLYFAGQINGTTGYEEAAAQGLVSGINAGLQVREEEAWTPRRDEGYVGVLIDDLITRGTTEPYRMFTSRAEYRLLLREDNADLRLTEWGRRFDLIDDRRWRAFEKKRESVELEQQRLRSTWVRPLSATQKQWESVLGVALSREQNLMDLLRRPEVTYRSLVQLACAGPGVADETVAEQVEVQAKYHGYIERQEAEIARSKIHEETPLPADLNYAAVKGLSAEVSQKLLAAKPLSLGQAGRIPGVTPAAISLLLIHLKKRAYVVAPTQRRA